MTKGAVYGKCIAANYQNVSKDMCAKEFMLLKDCYLVGNTPIMKLSLADTFLESRWKESLVLHTYTLSCQPWKDALLATAFD